MHSFEKMATNSFSQIRPMSYHPLRAPIVFRSLKSHTNVMHFSHILLKNTLLIYLDYETSYKYDGACQYSKHYGTRPTT